MTDEGLLDSAILLLSIGEEAAAEVMRFLGPGEVQKLGRAMAQLGNVTKDKMTRVLSRFNSDAQEQTSLGTDADYIRKVLSKALGSDKAALMLDGILQGSDASGLEALKCMDASSVAELIKTEHPQIIASILVHLERDQSAGVLGHFPEELRNDVVLRIATLDRIQPNALHELNQVLTEVLSGTDKLKRSALGGVRAAAEIVNFLGSAQETAVLDHVRAQDTELAQKILDEMFTFDDLADLDDRAFQEVLREVQAESLILALKGASESIREKVFKNMSKRAADTLREDLEAKGPVRLSEVEGEQKEILKLVRRLADEGRIVLGGKGEDKFV
jgi:flagellar motor switch protein FliG